MQWCVAILIHMDEIDSGYTTEAEMVKRALRKPFVLEAIRLLTKLSSTEITAAIDELTEERDGIATADQS